MNYFEGVNLHLKKNMLGKYSSLVKIADYSREEIHICKEWRQDFKECGQNILKK